MKKFESGFASHQSHESSGNHEVEQVKLNEASMTAMCGIATWAEYQIGEIAYGGHDQQVAHENLDRDLRRSADLGIVANIWPRTGLPF